LPIRFVLIELVQTFYDDILPNMNDSAYPYYQRAHEWATWVEKAGLGQAEMRLMKFITVLFKYTRDKGLTWFIIIDQQNALAYEKNEGQRRTVFYKRIIERFSRLRGCFIVFGASANNEEWQKKLLNTKFFSRNFT
jgi:hypothetical protein